MQSSSAELLRSRIREGTRSLRPIGLALLVFSAGLLVVAYATSSVVVEISSIAAFAFGVVVLLSELEPKVKLSSTNDSIGGSLLPLAESVHRTLGPFSAVFRPGDTEMLLVSAEHPKETLKLPAIGQDLYEEYAKELGPLDEKGLDHVVAWVPRAIVDGSGMARETRMRAMGDEIVTSYERPVVRLLCVKEYMTKNVCCSTGCPMVASVGQSLANGLGRPVMHVGCTYDPRTQIATSRHKATE